MTLQTLEQFKQDCRTGLRVHLTMSKVTEFAPIELSCRWKRQFESRVQRLTWEEFMTKKKNMLHRFMTLVANG